MSTPSPSTTDVHILAINNELAVLDLFRDILEAEGYRVSLQAYVERNLDAIATLSPDLIILDYMWAHEDAGWSLLQMLRMERRTMGIPIILCTGAVREVEALGAHLTEMGVRVVLKPFDIDRLLAVVAEALTDAARPGSVADERLA